MATLYIPSTETFSGKSALCVCLARRLQRDGYRVGYMKPVSSGERLAAGLVEFLTFPLPGVAVPDYTKHLGDRALPPIRPPLGITKP